MTDPVVWFVDRTAGAPGALRARARHYLEAVPVAGSRAAALAAAAELALAAAVSRGRDRAAALDLLAADGLITLALLAQAEDRPEALGDFASSLVGNTAA